MWGIAFDVAFPGVDFNGDYVVFLGSNPSGHPLTVIINSIANSLYMRYCYTSLNPLVKSCKTFRLHVNLFTYGDDNIMGVHRLCNWFNHTAIVATLDFVNITYTMADKEAPSEPFIHIDNASFLKRTWRYDVDVGGWLCPLAHESIEKSLTVWVKSKSIDPEEQMHSIIHSAHREYFYYGKAIFHEKKRMFEGLFEKFGVVPHFLEQPLPSWDHLNDQWHEAGR
jgi:hypothetical protein